MELKLLEDLLLLYETRNFSKAAEQRHITQPAFSRRIRSLENWFGLPLVDRTSRSPLKFTPSALQCHSDVRQLVNKFYELRNKMLAEADANSSQNLLFAVQHTLSVTYFPRVLNMLNSKNLPYSYHMVSSNNENCRLKVNRGEADILLSYRHFREQNTIFDVTDRTTEIGNDRLVPVVSSSNSDSTQKAPREGDLLKILIFPPDSYFGAILQHEILPVVYKRYKVAVVYVSAFSLGIKELVSSGMGIAWLPYSLVENELHEGAFYSLEEFLGGFPLDVILSMPQARTSAKIDTVWPLILGEFNCPLA